MHALLACESCVWGHMVCRFKVACQREARAHCQVWSGVASGDIAGVELGYLQGLSLDFRLAALGPHKKPRHNLSQKTPLHLVG
jgi:hypothetical protein